MEDLSRAELIQHCEKLQKKLNKYESRLSALVEAYKNLMKEKKMLEDTLKTLSKPSSSIMGSSSTLFRDDSPGSSDVMNDPLGALTPESVDSNQSQSSDMKALEEKIAALSNALQVMTENKAKTEAAFQADKKTMLADHKKEYEQLEEIKRKLEEELQETKQKLCKEQNDRESDQRNNSSMLKELQILVEAERIEKEEVKLQLKERLSKEVLKEYEEKVDDLNYELKQVKTRLEIAEQKKVQPQKEIQYLTEQVKNLQMKHAKDLVEEQNKVYRAEQLVRCKQLEDEGRVAELESRLTELSRIVGTYDKQRTDDQFVIRQLRERLTELEGNTSPNVIKDGEKQFDITADGKVTELHEQVVKLKSLLKISWKKTDRSLQRMSSSEIDELLANDPAHHACQEEYRQLKNEFELYKRKNILQKNTDKDKLSEEVVKYKKRIENLEELLRKQNKHFEESEKENSQIISQLQIDVTNLNDIYKRKVDDVKEEYKKYLGQADEELKKQRLRTMTLLNEKDIEIERLQQRLYENDDRPIISKIENEKQKNEIENETVVDEILSSPSKSPGNATYFHFNQQLAHLETDLTTARHEIMDLQGALRDSEYREEQVLQQMQALKEEIRRLERSRSRESANLEYLKNICLEFILTDSYSVKSQMLQAISAILMFSPGEVAKIEKKKQRSWWSSS